MVWQFRESISVSNPGRHQSTTLLNSAMVVVDAQSSQPLPIGRLAGWVYQSFPLSIGQADSFWVRLYYEKKLIAYDTALDGFYISFLPYWYSSPITLNIYTQD